MTPYSKSEGYIAPGGSFTSADIHPGEPYELSGGNKIECNPTGGRGAGPNAVGVSALEWDPDVKEAGVDAGYSPHANMLRAPDIAIGNVPNLPGWIQGVPPLAVEYADVGQNEDDLQTKIRELLEYGTKYIWVVRLVGPRRVEVYDRFKPMYVAYPGDVLSAPGVLRNAVPIEALYDREAARKVTLRNLLQSYGYADLDAVRQEGADAGFEQGWEQGRERGFEQGLERGITKGMMRGMELGMEKGLEQGLSRGMTRGMELGLEMGLRSSIQDVAGVLGLSLDADRLNALERMSAEELDSLRKKLITHKSWG